MMCDTLVNRLTPFEQSVHHVLIKKTPTRVLHRISIDCGWIEMKFGRIVVLELLNEMVDRFVC